MTDKGGPLTKTFEIAGGDFQRAGQVSTSLKRMLKELGIFSSVVRRIAICAYEAEMNVVMYTHRGTLKCSISPQEVAVSVEDEGPGIADIGLAMREGYSTATQEMREMGFGAGMGLPNIKRNADRLEIRSEVGRGTRLDFVVGLASCKAGEG